MSIGIVQNALVLDESEQRRLEKNISVVLMHWGKSKCINVDRKCTKDVQ